MNNAWHYNGTKQSKHTTHCIYVPVRSTVRHHARRVSSRRASMPRLKPAGNRANEQGTRVLNKVQQITSFLNSNILIKQQIFSSPSSFLSFFFFFFFKENNYNIATVTDITSSQLYTKLIKA
jgi:hypothetical protein